MKTLTRAEVVNLRDQLPKGTIVQNIKMNDEKYPVAKFMTGTVKHVDDIGTIHVNWDNGSTLGLIPFVDEFIVLKR